MSRAFRLLVLPLVVTWCLALPATAREELLLDAPGIRLLDPSDLEAQPPLFPFPAGEQLHYDVAYLGIPVGQAVFQVLRLLENGGERLAHVVLSARTNDFFSRIFRVDDRLEAWIDLDTLHTTATRTLIQHGKREIFEDLKLDWDLHWLELRREERHKGKQKEVAFDFGPAVQDVLPAFYYMRSFPLEPGGDRAFAVYASKKIYGLHLPVKRSGMISTLPFGKVAALELRPFVSLDGEPMKNGRGSVWVASGPGNVPLRLRGWVRTKDGFVIGRLALDLVHHESPPLTWKPGVPPEPAAVETVEGRPQWDPPAALQAARERLGVEPRDEKRKLDLEPR